MTKAGLENVEIAKKNDGSWYVLDDIEDLIIPWDIEAEFSISCCRKKLP